VTDPTDFGPVGSTVRADARAAARAFAAARRLAPEAGASQDEAAEAAAVLAAVLPVPVVRAAHRYGSSGTAYGVLVVRDLLPAFARLEPTPATVTPPSLGRDGRAAEMLLLAVMTLLGEPFTFASLYEGRLVQHVTAVPGREFAQTSEGSQARLDWHVEDAFTDSRCDYFGLLCLRGAPDAVTMLAPARMLRLPASAEKVLRQPRFVIAPDIAHGAGPASAVPLASVLSGPPGDPEIRYDSVYQQPAEPGDGEAAEALCTLSAAIDAAAVGITMEPGDLLITDNRRVVHGRTGYQPRYDGTGRWLLRVMACASSREHRRRRGVRVLPSSTGA
jgi:L-asparagine oxygenase